MLQKTQTDEAVLTEIGKRLARHRIVQGLTQAELAEEAGIGKRTLERVEAGQTAQLSTLIRILRALDLFARLDAMLPEAETRPLEAVARKGRKRQRASGRKKAGPSKPWTWNDAE